MPVLWVRVQRLSDYDDFDYDVLPWDIEMVFAEPDAVVDDNAVVAAADAEHCPAGFARSRLL